MLSLTRVFLTLSLSPIFGTPPAAEPGPAAVMSAASQDDPAAADLPGEDELRRAWRKASKSYRKKFPKVFRAQLEALDTEQMSTVRRLVEESGLDLRRVPERLGAEFFDPKKHARDQPVRRRIVDPESSDSMSLVRAMFREVPDRGLTTAYEYDYGTRQVVQVLGEPDDPDLLFENALAGYPPHFDLAEALVELELDDGSQQKAAAAFGHAYCDRDGKGYSAITIYDAWCSGREIEMPDVECLGIVHDVLDDWSTWKAPVSGRQQTALYERLEELFTDLRRHRGLRHALARCYLSGSAVLRDDYQSQLGTFQALWTTVDEDPMHLASILPDSREWRNWLIETAERIDEEEEDAWDEGQERIERLDADRAALRPFVVAALRECRILRE